MIFNKEIKSSSYNVVYNSIIQMININESFFITVTKHHKKIQVLPCSIITIYKYEHHKKCKYKRQYDLSMYHSRFFVFCFLQ